MKTKAVKKKCPKFDTDHARNRKVQTGKNTFEVCGHIIDTYARN